MNPKPTYQELAARVRELEEKNRVLETSRDWHEELFKHILHEIHVWSLVRDAQGEIQTWRLIDANPVALRSWGMKREDVVGRTTDEVFPGVDATNTFLPIVKKIFSERRPHVWETDFSGTDQRLYMVSIPVGDYFISAGFDVGPIRRNEQELQESLLQLSECVRAGRIGLWDWNLRTDRIQFSKEYKQQVGYGEEEFGDTITEWESRVHPDDLQATIAAVKRSIETRSDSYEAVFRFRHRDGSYLWILAHGSVIQDDSGQAVRMLGSHIDITQQKRLEDTLLQMQKTEALGTLAAGIAHDFNNLLTPILSCTVLAQRLMPADSEGRQYLANVRTAAARARDLVAKILLVSQGSKEDVGPVSLSVLLEEIIDLEKASSLENIEFDVDVDPHAPAILANASEIHQVFLNLCTNAIQAMPDGGVLRIRVGESAAPDSAPASTTNRRLVKVSVSDSGAGMEPSTLESIFDPFFTTKDQPDHHGTGLGLTIVNNVVAACGGSIEVDSAPGCGTTFDLCFPAMDPAAAPADEAPTAEPEPGSGRGSGRVLLVDDNELVCRSNTCVVEDLGYEVTPYTDPVAALERFVSDPDGFDLVISDYSMPALMGSTLAARMKAIRRDIPIIILTGYGAPSLEGEDSLRCDEVLAKPYDIEDLGRVIDGLLGNA